ncbi:MAG: EamA family transporter, partial [Cyanobacteria bacterium J06553_1]
IVSTALAYVIFFRILASAGAVNVALVTLLVPVSAILLGTLFLGEELAGRHYVGMGLIGIGLLAIDGRIGDRLRGKGSTGTPT